jgi:hypothetical protein
VTTHTGNSDFGIQNRLTNVTLFKQLQKHLSLISGFRRDIDEL